MRLARTAVVAVCALIGPAAAGEPPAQEPASHFRTQTNLIEVDVRVTDRSGDFVYGLTAPDFQVLDNGRERPIANIDLVDGRGNPTTESGPSDVSTNTASDQRGRIYLLVLDDLQTHPLRSETVKAAARLFVKNSLGPADRAAVVMTSGRTGPSQEFTNDRQRLLDAIDRFHGQKLPRTMPAYAGPGAPPAPGGRGAPQTLDLPKPVSPAYDEEGFDALTMLAGLRRWATWLSGLRSTRKALVLVSEGIGFDTADVFARVDASLVENAIRDTLDAAVRNNVAIYPIDPRGLPTGRSGEVPVTQVPDDEFFSIETMRAKMTLRALASATGGFALTNSNDFAGAFARIVRESSTYYLLGFPGDSLDRQLHTVTVRVKRPGLEVRSRRTYIASSPAPAARSVDARLTDVVGRALPTAGLPIRVTAAPFRLEKNRTVLLVTAELDLAGDRSRGELALRIAAVAKDGRVGAVQSFAVTPQDGTSVRAVCELPLRPGEYQIRVAAVSTTSAGEGSVYREVVVPRLGSNPLSVAGPFLGSSSLRKWTAFAPADLRTRLTVIPTAQRVFQTVDELTVLSVVYADLARGGAATMTGQIVDGSGTVQLMETRPIDAKPQTQVAMAFRLASLAPNRYTLRLTTGGASGRGKAVVREIPFTVSP